ncbi:MAG: glutaredoxin family protein [Candidatus ainarchaeum sp.]|jgi:glutaredoxin-like YruB-family protein|nr:glutaredoxin family protein [Candidatus ainarchaeum sp.]MDD3085629.1 glutaredoxin family protein [Candidatus ainarchaeum sp.]MDD4128413.1 glutaredoxin family protein [Candidatus ainarchaeum sp.]MDD4467686.1 glutaredoxin family protein [Candidatus ainarchaeum sp.]HPM85486.1 glutaredoxin family protein [archaeon]
MTSVIVYSTNTCPYCVMAKQWLKEKKVDFEEVNVGIDQEKAKEMIQKSGQMGVPVIDIGGDIIIGFDRPKMEGSLKTKGLIK